MSYDLGTAHGKIELEYSGGVAAEKAKHDVNDIGDEAKQAERKVDGLEGSLNRLGGGLAAFGKSGGRAGGFAILGVGAVNAAVAAGQLALNVAATVNALAPLVSFAALLPAGIVAAGAASIVLKTAMAGVADAMKAAFSSDPKQFAEAIKGLAPQAQATAKAFRAIVPELKAAQQAIQNTFFTGLAPILTNAAKALLPLQANLKVVAGDFNSVAQSVGKFAAESGTVGFLGSSIGVLHDALSGLASALPTLLGGLRSVGQVGIQGFSGLGDSINRVATHFGDWMKNISANGQLQQWLAAAKDQLSQLGYIASNIGGILSQAFQLAGAQGHSLFDTLALVSGQLYDFLHTAEGQTALSNVFAALHDTASALAPIFTTLVQIIGTALAPVLSTIATAVGPALLTVVNALGPAIGALTGPLQTLAQALAQGLTSLAPALQPLGEALGMILTALAPLLPVIGNFLQGAVIGLSAALKVLVSLLGPIIGQFATLAAQLSAKFLPVVAQAVQDLLPLFVDAMGKIAGVVTTLMPLMPALADAFLNLILPSLVEFLKAILPSIGDIAVAFAGFLVALTPLIPTLVQLATMFLEILIHSGALQLVMALLQTGLSLVEGAFNLLTSAVGFARDAFSSAKEAGSAIANFFTTTLPGAVNTVLTFFQQLPGKILGFLQTLPGLLSGALTDALNAAAYAVGFGIGLVYAYFSNLPGRISNALSTVGSLLSGVFTSAWNIASNAVSTGVNAVINYAQALPGRISSTLSSLPGILGGAFSRAWNAASDAVSSGVGRVVDFIRGLPGKALSAVSGMEDIGRAIVQGLINGIENLAGAAASAAKRMVGNAIKGATDALKIGSPSKVFFQIGNWTGEGFADGILALLAKVKQAGDLLAQSAISPLLPSTAQGFQPALPLPSAGTATAPVAPSQVTINNNVQALPGMDAAAVAQYTTRRLLAALELNASVAVPIPQGA